MKLILTFAFILITTAVFCQTTASDTIKYNMMIAGKRDPIIKEISKNNIIIKGLYEEFKWVRVYDSLMRVNDSLWIELEKWKFKPFTNNNK